MPNQRSKDKAYLGGYVHKDLYAEIVRLAKQEGSGDNKFGFVATLIREGIERRGKRVGGKAKSSKTTAKPSKNGKARKA